MSKYALVSIIVPVYKVEKYLDACVSSLVNQTYKNIEIILVDDGSPDNSGDIIDAWAIKDHRIKVIHKPNGGVSSARNAGIKLATGEFLVFVDSDDVVSSQLIELLMKYRDTKLLPACKIVRFAENIPKISQSNKLPVVQSQSLVKCRGGLFAVGALYTRQLIEQMKLRFDDEIGNLEDSVWNCEYLCYVSEVLYIDSPLYFYRVTPMSITSKSTNIRWQISCWLKARSSIMHWFAKRTLTRTQRKYAARTFRYCQNNIFAECVAGNISYNELYAMETGKLNAFNQSLIPALERFIRKHLPKLYYVMYTSLIRVKNAIRKWKK